LFYILNYFHFGLAKNKYIFGTIFDPILFFSLQIKPQSISPISTSPCKSSGYSAVSKISASGSNTTLVSSINPSQGKKYYYNLKLEKYFYFWAWYYFNILVSSVFDDPQKNCPLRICMDMYVCISIKMML
jgi:hypothetical protein